MIPPGFLHGRITMTIGASIALHVQTHELGTVVAAETGFVLTRDPDTVRAPDVAFVRASRPAGPQRGYYPGAPDLAVEVLSPDDRPGYVREKVAEWLEAGTVAVWVVDPRKRTVTIHQSGRAPHENGPAPSVLGESDTLRGGDLLPGFELLVRELFDPGQ